MHLCCNSSWLHIEGFQWFQVEKGYYICVEDVLYRCLCALDPTLHGVAHRSDSHRFILHTITMHLLLSLLSSHVTITVNARTVATKLLGAGAREDQQKQWQ